VCVCRESCVGSQKVLRGEALGVCVCVGSQKVLRLEALGVCRLLYTHYTLHTH